MKYAYPIILTQGSERIAVYVPDFQINIYSNSYAEAIYQTRDAIGTLAIEMEAAGESIPRPSSIADYKHSETNTIALVDIDFANYRKKTDQRSVLRSVSLPCWLDAQVRNSNINVSGVLQKALIQELGIVG